MAQKLIDDTYEKTLTRAASLGHSQLIKALLRLKTNVDARTNDLKWTPLIEASNQGHAMCVQILLEGGADPNLEAPDGSTALGLAAEQGHRQCVRLLLEAGATGFNEALQLAGEDNACVRLLKAGIKNKAPGKKRPKFGPKYVNAELFGFGSVDDIPPSE